MNKEEAQLLIDEFGDPLQQSSRNVFDERRKKQQDEEESNNLVDELTKQSKLVGNESLESGPLPVATAKMPATMAAGQIKTMIVNDLGGKPQKDNEYKFGITGLVKMSTSFDPAGNLTGIKGNNYSAMAQTLSNAGVKSISIEGSPLRAFRMLRESVKEGLSVSNVSITKSFPIGDRAWSYDSTKTEDINKKNFQDTFSFIPKDDVNAVFKQLMDNRNNLGMDSKNTMTPTPSPEQKSEEEKVVELVSDIKVESVNDLLEHQSAMEEMEKQTGEKFEMSVNDDGHLTTKGSDANVMASYLAGQKATQISGFPDGQKPSAEVKSQLERNEKEKNEEEKKDETKSDLSGMQPGK
jgi:hypothetical protein